MNNKKKTLIIVLSVVGVIVLAAVIAIAVIFTREPAAPPAAKEGVIYQTRSESLWANTSSAYMTFEYIEEPDEPVEGEVYGYVFRAWVKNNDSGTWEDWLTGTWEMNDAKTSLTLTATWSGDNATALADATSGTPKTYTAKDGKFTIGVNYPGGATGKVVFTLDPAADLVGETPDGGGPEQGDQGETDPPAATVSMTLTATAAGGQEGKLELMSDSTWTLSVSYYDGMEPTPTASGTWALGADYNITLTVTEDAANVLAEDSYTLACDYDTQTYSGRMDCTVPVAGALSFDFVQETAAPVVVLTATDAQTTMTAEIELFTDGTFNFCLDMMGGRVFGGTWASTDPANFLAPVTLTPDETGAAVIGNAVTVTLTPDASYSVITYGCHVDYVVPGAISMSFDFTGTLDLGTMA